MHLGLSRDTSALCGGTGLSSLRKTGVTWNTTLFEVVPASLASTLCTELDGLSIKRHSS